MALLQLRRLGRVPYDPVWQAMREFTDQRRPETPDEIWFVEHDPVYTQGQAGKPEHILDPGAIPVIRSDRGGQITYHGPGQLVSYLLLDLRRLGIGVRELVTLIEQVLIALLADYGIDASARADAPGVYHRSGAKLAQLGLRIRRGCSFHGLSLNVNVDPAPFKGINPCGQSGLEVANMADFLSAPPAMALLIEQLTDRLVAELGYTDTRRFRLVGEPPFKLPVKEWLAGPCTLTQGDTP